MQRSFQKYKSEDGQTLILPTEMLGAVELPASAVKAIVKPKREAPPPTPAQVEARKKFAEMAREKSRQLKEARDKQASQLKENMPEIKEEVDRFKEDMKKTKLEKEQEKVAAGTHVRVVIKQPTRRRRKEDTTTTDESTTDVTETEDEEYKPKQRAIRRQAKKLVKTVQKIDQVIQQAPVNPYASMLASRWR